MLEAKAAGRNRVCELDAIAQQRLDRRGRLRRELGHAIEQERLSAVFQPLWDVQRQCLSGVELLARWHDPELGWVSPAEFIPLAEESGQIAALGLWAIRAAVHAAIALRAAGHWTPDADAELRVSVNVSTVQLADPMLVETLVGAVADAGGEPGWIELELTESVQLAEDPETQKRMRRLREAGFSLAIDDFGAGYSSFSYLSRLYFDRLKIDRALVSAAMQAGDRSAVTGSIIVMAHRLGLQVVAEGIETVAQVELLAQQGCDILQGYGIARPMPLADLLQWRVPPSPPAVPSQRGLQGLPSTGVRCATSVPLVIQ
jgi:EAL domain-containing protein (putative c-di-GMP-specific phosphodiesterase class I)